LVLEVIWLDGRIIGRLVVDVVQVPLVFGYAVRY
jgi:hypothetical protein